MIKKNDITSLRLDKILLQLLFPCYVDSYYATKEYNDYVVKQHDKTDKSYCSEEDLPDDLLFDEEDEEDDIYDLFSYDRGGDFVSDLSVIPEATNTTCSTTTFCSRDITSRSSHDCVITTRILTNASSLTLDDVDKNNSKRSTIYVDARDNSATTVRSEKSWKASPFLNKSDSGSLRPIRVYQGIHNCDIKTESSCSTIETKSNDGKASSVLGISYSEPKTVSTMDATDNCLSSGSAKKWECSSKSGSRIVSDDNLVQNNFYCKDLSSGSGRARNNTTSSAIVSCSLCEKNSFESLVRNNDSGFTTKSNRSKIQGSTCSIDGSQYSTEKINTDIDARYDNLSLSSLRKYQDDSKIYKPVQKTDCKDLSSGSGRARNNNTSSSLVSSSICEKNSFESLVRNNDSGFTTKSNRSKIQGSTCSIDGSKYCTEKINTDIDSRYDNLSLSSLRKYQDDSKISDNKPVQKNDCNDLSSGSIVSQDNPVQNHISYRDLSSESQKAVGDNTNDESSISCNIFERNNSERSTWKSSSGITNKSSGCLMKNLSKIEEYAFLSLDDNRDEEKTKSEIDVSDDCPSISSLQKSVRRKQNGSSVPSDNFPMRQNVYNEHSSSDSVYTRNSATDFGLSLLSSDDCVRNNSKGSIRISDSSVATKSTSRNLKKISNDKDHSLSIMDKIFCDKNLNEMDIISDLLRSFSSQNHEGRNRSGSSIAFGDSAMDRCYHCQAFSGEINSTDKNTTASSDASKSDIKDMKNTPASTATQYNEKDYRGRKGSDERRDDCVPSARLQRLEQNENQSFNTLKMGDVTGIRTKDAEYKKSFSSRQKHCKVKFRFLNSDKHFWLPCLRTPQLRCRKWLRH